MNKQNENGKKRRDIKPEFIISPVPQQPIKKISEAQRIQLDVISHTNFNFFDGRLQNYWKRIIGCGGPF
jgi:hypothetical protein